MHILILNWKDIKNPTSGGAEIVTHEHARRWVQKGHRVTWLCSSYGNLPNRERYDGINFYRFGNIYTVYLFAPFFYIFSGLKFDSIVDEVHGIPFFSRFYSRKPITVLIHEIAGEIWDYTFPFPVNSFGKILESIYLKLYRNGIFWTDASSTVDDLVSRGVPRKNCIAIPCPSNAVPLRKLPTKNSNPTFITVSRIVKMKGIEDVIDAFSQIHKVNKNAELWVVGGGEESYIKSLKERKITNRKLNKRIKFWGYVGEKEKLTLMSKAHLLLHASVKEGWGLVVIEAASQGTPSIVYNVEGLKDSVKNGKTGIVISENTPDRMAQEAIKLLENSRNYELLQRNALEYAKSLNWDRVSQQSLNLLQNKK